VRLKQDEEKALGPEQAKEKRVRVSEQLGQTLLSLGVSHAFSLVGSGNFHLTRTLVDGGAELVLARHEGPATTMADAYARTTGNVGIVTLHQGCGLTNTATAIAEAVKSRTPLLVIAAEMPAAATNSNQFFNQTAFAVGTSALAERIHSPETAVADLTRAYHLAKTQRTAVVLNAPIDIQDATAVPTEVRFPVQLSAPTASAADVEQLAELLRTARSPVFIAGRGARAAEARDALKALGDRCGALLATSAVARGLFAGDPWSLDVSGGFATPLCRELLPQADLVVAWGAGLNVWTTVHGDVIGPHATTVQVDLDAMAIGRHYPVEFGVVGDVTGTANAVLDNMKAKGHGGRGWRTDKLKERLRSEGRWNDVSFEDLSTDDAIDPRVLSRALDEMLPAERTVAVDSGNFMAYPAMYFSVPDHEAFCFTQGFQSIGLGLPSAIGASAARPDRLSIAACGDGGLLASLSELETVARLKQPMVLVVYNDQAYGAEVHHFGDANLDIVRFPDTDFAAIARALGLESCTVRATDDLAPLQRWLEGPRERSFLVDAKIAEFPAWFLKEAFRH
jgi:thiamine pyrophosphate-dependent acetolactate synthase large subunit-like protein